MARPTNERDAIRMATDAFLAVSEDRREGRYVDFRGRTTAARVSFTVGAAVVFHDRARGGSACWRVLHDGRTYGHGYRGEALAYAVDLQCPGRGVRPFYWQEEKEGS